MNMEFGGGGVGRRLNYYKKLIKIGKVNDFPKMVIETYQVVPSS